MKSLIYFLNLRWLLLSLLIVCLDLFTKYLVIHNCIFGESIVIFPFFNLHYICNFGIAFSLFSDFGVKRSYILLCLIILIVMIFIVMLCFENRNCIKIAYSMVIGGALGNFLDRILYSAVVDFIDIHIFDYHFPIFNFADLSIFFGIFIILYFYK